MLAIIAVLLMVGKTKVTATELQSKNNFKLQGQDALIEQSP